MQSLFFQCIMIFWVVQLTKVTLHFPEGKKKVLVCLHFRNVGIIKRKNVYEVLLGI